MAKRKRNIQILFCVSPEEKKLIRRKMIESKTKNMGAYLRKMAIDGYIVNTDTTPLKKQYEEMHKIGVNINQIAKKVNSTGDLYPEEKKLIRRKMIESKTKNMGAYLRKMAIDGYIVNTDTTPLKKQYEEMHKIGVNINQIAKKVNSTGDLYPEEMQELKEMVQELWRILRSSPLK